MSRKFIVGQMERPTCAYHDYPLSSPRRLTPNAHPLELTRITQSSISGLTSVAEQQDRNLFPIQQPTFPFPASVWTRYIKKHEPYHPSFERKMAQR